MNKLFTMKTSRYDTYKLLVLALVAAAFCKEFVVLSSDSEREEDSELELFPRRP